MTPEREAEIRASVALTRYDRREPGDSPGEQIRDTLAALDVEREKVARLERERDELAAHLAALRAEVRDVLAEPHAYIGNRERTVLTCAVAAATAPAVEAYTRRVQAEALESAADRHDAEHPGWPQSGAWLRARARELRGGR